MAAPPREVDAVERDVRACLIGRDSVLSLAPPPRDRARETLGAILAAWQAGRVRPLRVTQRAGMAWAQVMASAPTVGDDDADAATAENALSAARKAYEGDFSRSGEGDDPVLARLFDDAEALLGGSDGSGDGDDVGAGEAPSAVAEGRFPLWASVLYRPLVDWCAEHVQAQPLPQAAVSDENDDEGEGRTDHDE